MTRPRAFSPRLAAAGVVAGLLVVWVVAPAPAAAFSLDGIVGKVVGAGLSFAANQVAGAAVAALLGIVKFLVGDVDQHFAQHLVRFLLDLPDYTSAQYATLDVYAGYVRAVGWGLLGLVLVGSALRYWAAGYCAASAGEATLAFQRTAAAAAGLVGYGPGWHFATLAVNKLTFALITGPGVGAHPDELFVDALSFSPPGEHGAAFAGLVGLAALGCAVWLLVTKTVLLAAFAVLYLAAPLAIALGPLQDDLGWVTGIVARGFVGVLAYPVIWALCFAAFALLLTDAVPAGPGALGQAVASFSGLAALLVAIRLPRMVLERGLGYTAAPRPGGTAGTVRVLVRATRGRP